MKLSQEGIKSKNRVIVTKRAVLAAFVKKALIELRKRGDMVKRNKFASL